MKKLMVLLVMVGALAASVGTTSASEPLGKQVAPVVDHIAKATTHAATPEWLED